MQKPSYLPLSFCSSFSHSLLDGIAGYPRREGIRGEHPERLDGNECREATTKRWNGGLLRTMGNPFDRFRDDSRDHRIEGRPWTIETFLPVLPRKKGHGKGRTQGQRLVSLSCPIDVESDEKPSGRCVEHSNPIPTLGHTRSERIVPWIERTRERGNAEKDPESSGVLQDPRTIRAAEIIKLVMETVDTESFT